MKKIWPFGLEKRKFFVYFNQTNIKNALKAKSKIYKNTVGTHTDLKKQWEDLLISGIEFRNKYDQFLAIVCTYTSTSEYGDEFCDFSTTRIRLQLLSQSRQKLMLFVMQICKNLYRIRKNVQKNLEKRGGYALFG
uniref:Uncharacterized protein n=1 Tax=Meloidogyne enterolobii TaxID=390850 RepID=A0A6V7UCD7_MELEN|nr:unnamed protein product [Meloidogyne enterolobii]